MRKLVANDKPVFSPKKIFRYHRQNPRNCSTISNQVGEGSSGETSGQMVATVPTDEVDHPYSTANWIRAQHEDDNIRFIVKKIKLRTEISELERRNAGPVLKTFIENFSNLFLNSKGILSIHENRKTDEGVTSRHQLAVVPEAWYERVMKTAHKISGHFAAENTLERARLKLWFPRMRMWAEEVVKTCPQCVTKLKNPNLSRSNNLRSGLQSPTSTLTSPIPGEEMLFLRLHHKFKLRKCRQRHLLRRLR